MADVQSPFERVPAESRTERTHPLTYEGQLAAAGAFASGLRSRSPRALRVVRVAVATVGGPASVAVAWSLLS